MTSHRQRTIAATAVRTPATETKSACQISRCSTKQLHPLRFKEMHGSIQPFSGIKFLVKGVGL